MKRLVCLLVVGLWSSRAVVAETRWTRLRSEHFTFVGETSERALREVAVNLERFREALSRVLPRSAVDTSVPTIVFVFQNDSSLTPYKPTFQGKPVELAGFFSGWTDRTIIALNAAARQSALRVVFHEYAHFLVQNTNGRLPPWANEGLAGFYETFEERNSGRSAVIGAPIVEYLALLKSRQFMPLADLLAIDYSSPEYHEGDRRSLFYAESWALMHYLQLGSPRRAAELSAYLARLHNGGDPAATFSSVFGDPAVLERELRDYLRTFSVPAIRLEFGERVSVPVVASSDALTDTDRATYLADLLARSGHVDQARSRLTKLLDENPNAVAAAETLGVLELNNGNAERALPWLERAAREGGDAAAQVLWGRAVVERYEAASGDTVNLTARLADVRVTLTQAAQLRPDDADMLATLGRAESIAGEDIDRALALLDRAVTLAPGQEEYRLMLAQELVRQRQFQRATEILGPLTASARRPEIREAARLALAHIAERSDTRRERLDGPPLGLVRFRIPRPNETRAVGLLTAVDCVNGSIVLHVDTEDESLRLSAAGLDALQYMSYRTASARLSCGAISPASRVFATYIESDAARQATGIDGQVKAIEELPEGYEVR